MAQKKLYRFAQLKTFPNVLEYPEDMPGNWNGFFKNKNPITLELACGRGEYTVGLSKMYPEKNFIGIDVKGNRMYIGAKQSLESGLANAAFLRTQIEKLPDYFNEAEVDEIWITFPDPQLRVSKAKKRLTHPRFLQLYSKVLKPGGYIHLKTDSPDLYDFTKLVITLVGATLHEVLTDTHDAEKKISELTIKTHYESLDIAGSRKIHYLKFSLPAILPQKEEELKNILLHEQAAVRG